ncbi:MAG: hypothetical protein ACKPKO_03570, partial [Candidatus Fonsibacter sp.]
DKFHRWRLVVRAGGAAAFVLMEVSVYPWRGIMLTSHGDCIVEAVAMGVSLQASDGIDEFMADASACPNMCFIDPAFRLMWKMFPSRQLLLSVGVCLHHSGNTDGGVRQHSECRAAARWGEAELQDQGAGVFGVCVRRQCRARSSCV